MMSKTGFLFLAGSAAAQSLNQTATAVSTSSNGSAVANPTAFATSLQINLQDYWNILVGPVDTAYYTTTVSPTPVPSQSLIPPPPLYYSPFPTGQQVPAMAKNESWSFPRDFWWGVAGAAYQIEGAADADGRGPSVWDKFARVPDFIADGSDADITNNNYFMYKLDIARLAAQGVKAYSFTISWSRIFPFGRGPVNQIALDHYSDVVDTCIEYGIEPIVTLYHWDLPLYLQDTYGGWLSEEIVRDFAEYARVVYAAYGDRVAKWFTMNEPIVFCNEYPYPAEYFKNSSIPDVQQPFYCGHHFLLAHAEAYHIGKSMMPHASISYKNNGGYKIPLTNSSADLQATQRAWDFNEGWFSEPVFLTGDYPESVKTFVSDFLPDFTDGQKRSILGSSDIYAHDAYTSQFYFAPAAGIESCVNNATNSLYPTCANTTYTYAEKDGGWLIGPAADPSAPWLHKATDWVPTFLHYMQDTWAKGKPIAVTEFGFAEPFEAQKELLQDILTDPIRTAYYHDYMQAILIAMSEGVNVVGTLAWSLYDNYEWAEGFTSKFGIQYCNFTDPKLPRYYKASFFEYVNAFTMYQEK